MDPSVSIEVRFSQDDLHEQSKKQALQAYNENKHMLGMIFSEPAPDTPKQLSKLPDDIATRYKAKVEGYMTEHQKRMDKLNDLANSFYTSLGQVREGNIEEARESASGFKLMDDKMSYFAFEERVDPTVSRMNLLPYTSRDNVTIHQIK